MVVCIPLVFRVRALRLWCVLLEVMGDAIGGDWLLGVGVAGFSVVGEGEGFRVAVGVVFVGC
jgi:hypothetical protein